MTEWLNRCHFGDVRAVLRRMVADGVQVHTIVTSPPYWGLRSYLPADHPDKALEIGSEPTLGEFIAGMVEVFDLCRRVLRDDGTMWVNMGDSYASNAGGYDPLGSKSLNGIGSKRQQAIQRGDRTVLRSGLKPKDLIGQPWRLAFALQDGTCACSACGHEQPTSAWPSHNGHRVCVPCLIEGRTDSKVLPAMPGWWLRQDVIWHKPNPMPESTRDRCTKAHEYIFLMSKSERYYFDQDAIRTPLSAETKAQSFETMEFKARDRYKTPTGWAMEGSHTATDWATAEKQGRGSKRNSFARESKNTPGEHGQKPQHRPDRDDVHYANSANKRSVWTVATEAYPGSHFATFPRALIEPCVLAGAPAGGIVLDPFFGSGTTGQVAQQLGRQFIGIDLNRDNEPLQADRLRQPSLFLEAA